MKEYKRRNLKLTTFGLSVKKRLLDKGMTQKELARELGIHGCYLTEILYGIRAGWKYREQIEDILSMKKSV